MDEPRHVYSYSDTHNLEQAHYKQSTAIPPHPCQSYVRLAQFADGAVQTIVAKEVHRTLSEDSGVVAVYYGCLERDGQGHVAPTRHVVLGIALD